MSYAQTVESIEWLIGTTHCRSGDDYYLLIENIRSAISAGRERSKLPPPSPGAPYITIEHCGGIHRRVSLRQPRLMGEGRTGVGTYVHFCDAATALLRIMEWDTPPARSKGLVALPFEVRGDPTTYPYKGTPRRRKVAPR